MKLSMRGSLAWEHHKLARLALETGKPKTVLWGLDYFSLKSTQDDQGAFPFYLYDDNVWNDYRYWYNYTAYEQLIKGLIRQARTGHAQGLEGLYNWNFFSKFGEEVTVKNFRKLRREEATFTSNEDPLEAVQASFKKNIESLVQAYPDVHFLFYYPPYSILDRKSTRLNSSHIQKSRMPSSA